MAIRHFDVGPTAGLEKAAAEELPNLVGIAGPNGSGKSTVIEQLRRRRNSFLEATTELMFLGAHRTWRSAPVSEVAVLGFAFGYEDVLKQDTIPSFTYQPPQGLHWLPGLARQASTADDAQALVKTALIRINNQQRDLVTREFRAQRGKVEEGTVPDLFMPFIDLVQTLLPHLEWKGIDTSNANDIKCLFASAAREDPQFDIDQLSSGEKEAVALFLPFIEREVKLLTGEVEPTPSEIVPVTVLIDEPEIHLHPLLQLNVLDYMRGLVAVGRAQFIFTTHSPTLLDALDNSELFLLSPAELAGENQLSRMAHSSERLEMARAITGSTHVLTRCKPIVLIEGEPDIGATASDERLLRLIVPDVAHWALVPMSGKSQVVKSAVDMRRDLHLPGVPVFGLVDADVPTDLALPDFVVTWPVSMVENLLLDVGAVWDVLAPYQSVVGLDGEDAIRIALREIAAAQRDDEVQRRFQARLPHRTLRATSPNMDALRTELVGEVDEFLDRVRSKDPATLLAESTAAVDELLADERYLEGFHGKRLLRAFYDRYGIDHAGLGWNAFLTQLARAAADRPRSVGFTQPAIDKIRLYFPPGLAALLEAEVSVDSAAAELTEQARHHREAWERGEPDGTTREGLRASVFRLAREIAASRGPAAAQPLFTEAASIGTP